MATIQEMVVRKLYPALTIATAKLPAGEYYRVEGVGIEAGIWDETPAKAFRQAYNALEQEDPKRILTEFKAIRDMPGDDILKAMEELELEDVGMFL
jgi:hypothetical protein